RAPVPFSLSSPHRIPPPGPCPLLSLLPPPGPCPLLSLLPPPHPSAGPCPLPSLLPAPRCIPPQGPCSVPLSSPPHIPLPGPCPLPSLLPPTASLRRAPPSTAASLLPAPCVLPPFRCIPPPGSVSFPPSLLCAWRPGREPSPANGSSGPGERPLSGGLRAAGVKDVVAAGRPERPGVRARSVSSVWRPPPPRMSNCSSRALTLLSSVFGACGLLLVGIAVSTDYWLYMEEGIVLQQNQTTE
uniref:Uncharacterized protein n=1 Tax=Pelusios castaneus TaxID=367368 RepID=A0A8C8SEL5_9SAUR